MDGRCIATVLVLYHCHVLVLVRPVLSADPYYAQVFRSGTPLRHMVVDTQLESGRVYVGAENAIYQLTPELDQPKKFKTGPRLMCPSQQAAGVGQCRESEKTEQPVHNKGLAIHAKGSRLIACGTYMGRCRFHNLFNVSDVDTDHPVNRPVVVSNPELSTVLFVGPGPPNPASNQVLYVANTLPNVADGFEDIPSVASLSLEIPRDKTESRLKLAHKMVNAETQISIEKTVREVYSIEYVTGFTSGNFSYFVTRQPIEDDLSKGGAGTNNKFNGEQESKLIRVCNRDMYYYSYTEVPLRCNPQGGSTQTNKYNLIQDAFVAKPGYDLARELGVTPEDDVLFAVFAEGTGDRRTRPSMNSALCVYSLQAVEDVFLQNIKECASGQSYRGLDFMRRGKHCQATNLPANVLTCGSEVNYPLGGRIAVKATAAAWSDKGFTSVVARSSHHFTVAFVGTKEGQVVKFIVRKETEAKDYASISVNNDKRPIMQDLNFDISNLYLYAMTQYSITKVPVQNCGEYRTCSDCVAAEDPMCGWCSVKNACSLKEDCRYVQWLDFEQRKCTTIVSVDPSQIQITTAKYISLSVENLPTSQAEFYCVFELRDRLIPMPATPKQSAGVQLLTCETPQNLPLLGQDEDHVDAKLSIAAGASPTDARFASTNFTFYDCAKYTSCHTCVSGRFRCDWCTQTGICTHSTDNNCRTLHIVNAAVRSEPTEHRGKDFCAGFVLPDPEILLPAGTTRQIQVRHRNLKSFMTNFTCEYTIGSGAPIALKALVKDEFLECARHTFDYYEAAPNKTGKLVIKWDGTYQNRAYRNKELDNPQGVRVVIYKCEQLANNCGQCLSTSPKLQCGWCEQGFARPQCTINRACNRWLNRSAACPNPQITRFHPESGPIEGGTELTIEGVNLGRSFIDIKNAVSVNKNPCRAVEDKYVPTQRIVCITGKAEFQKKESGPVAVVIPNNNYDSESPGSSPKEFVFATTKSFSYVKPTVTSMSPASGPMAGGTTVTFTGTDLNSGTDVKITLAKNPCEVIPPRLPTSLRCMTGAADSQVKGILHVSIDSWSEPFSSLEYYYTANPVVVSSDSRKSIVSGGLTVTVHGMGFRLIQKPYMQLHYGGRVFQNGCRVVDGTRMHCYTPALPLSPDSPNYPSEHSQLIAPVSFKLDGVETPVNNTHPFHIYPDPIFERFRKDSSGKPVKEYKDEYITIHGKNLDLATRRSDVVVWVGRELCNGTQLAPAVLTCKPPITQPQKLRLDSPFPEVIVQIGSRNHSIGYLSYNTTVPYVTIVAIVVSLLIFLLALCALFVALYRRKSTRHVRQMKHLQEQIVNIELKVAAECKEAFAELQTDMTEFSSEMVGSGIPYLPYREYALRVLFPQAPPLLEFAGSNSQNVNDGLVILNQLLMNKTFLLTVIRTLEASRYFLGKDRVYVGSVLMVILQEKLEYCTDILKTLLAELIERTVERRLQPRILFRRSESVAERMLGAWFTFLMHRYMLECAGQPLFMLYWAIKQQVEKGPQDGITYEARYSLSEQKLLRQAVDAKKLTVLITGLDMQPVDTAVAVLDCDTITQVKEKCLDAIYRFTPYSHRPAASDLDLEWRTGISGRLVLQDLDISTKTEPSGWKKMNTLAHYKVTNNATLFLVPKQSSVFNLSALSEPPSDKSLRSFSTFSLSKNSPTLNRALSPLTPFNAHEKDSTMDAGYKIYHLVKPQDIELGNDKNLNGKLVSEIYLTRLLTAKGTLQKFVEDLFETAFSIAHRGSALPLCVKYMFDFLDDQALQHGIADTDPDTVHAWKSNSLPLRFWVNLIKNPHFVFDIVKPSKIEGCLSVVAQTLMDSCSTQDHQLTKDSPSSKLLFARDIPVYREWVDKYYHDIKSLPATSDQDMNAFLNEESRRHQNQFPVFPALFQLHKYIHQYKDQILENLEQDEFSCRNRLPHKFLKYQALMGDANGVC